jgi:peptidyl-prolyl cis-trans isomerase SurA
VNAGDMVPEFNQVMLDSPVGKVSMPFHTQFGWHILEVQAKRETDVGVENQRNQVRNMLYQRRFEEELPIWLRKIRSEAYVEIKS